MRNCIVLKLMEKTKFVINSIGMEGESGVINFKGVLIEYK